MISMPKIISMPRPFWNLASCIHSHEELQYSTVVVFGRQFFRKQSKKPKKV